MIVGWMVVEAIVAVGAGTLAGSLLLVAFGIDSVIELVAGGTPVEALQRGAGRVS